MNLVNINLAKTISIAFMVLASAFATAENKQVTVVKADSDKKAEVASKMVNIEMVTSLGTIMLELDSEKAPLSVKNFVDYANEGFYDGTIFHRVIKDFMVQGGGFTPDMNRKATKAQIKNESFNGLKNNRGTIAMARTNAPHSATSQFFINHVDNGFLNKGPRGIGYAVFGKVTSGMDVVDAIANIKTGRRDVPQQTIMIKSVKVEKKDDKKVAK